jgi:hypothetical protein
VAQLVGRILACSVFGSMQAVFGRRFSKNSKTLENIDFFGFLPFQKNTDKMF